MRLSTRKVALVRHACAAAVLTLAARGARAQTSTIVSNFNGTAIPVGNFVWFNSVFNPSGTYASGTTLRFVGGSVLIGSGGSVATVAIPNATVTFSSATTAPSTVWTGSEWQTTVPVTYTGNVFLSGTGFLSAGLPGGINPVSWTETVQTNATVPVSVQWQWAAAVYDTFGPNGALDVKAIDQPYGKGEFHNADHAGTPEAFVDDVTGGARGGGGSNVTGSYSATASLMVSQLIPPPTTTVPEPATLGLFAVGGAALGGGPLVRRRRTPGERTRT